MNLWKKERKVAKNILLRVLVTVLTAVIMAATYPVYEALKISDKVYATTVSVAGFLMIWLVLAKIEDQRKNSQ